MARGTLNVPTKTVRNGAQLQAFIEQLENNGDTLNRALIYVGVLTSNHCKALGEALKVNRTLLEVNLSYNLIKAEGAKHIAEGLAQNRTLQKINLSNNGIGSKGAKYIAEALKQNNTLQVIDLGNNDIGKSGAMHIANALADNSALRDLDLRGNRIEDEGAKDMAKALVFNSTLWALGLSENSITLEGAGCIACGLGFNYALQELGLTIIRKADEEGVANEMVERMRRYLDISKKFATYPWLSRHMSLARERFKEVDELANGNKIAAEIVGTFMASWGGVSPNQLAMWVIHMARMASKEDICNLGKAVRPRSLTAQSREEELEHRPRIRVI